MAVGWDRPGLCYLNSSGSCMVELCIIALALLLLHQNLLDIIKNNVYMINDNVTDLLSIFYISYID